MGCDCSNCPGCCHNDSKHAVDHDNKIIETDSYLELDKSHKDWYKTEMGKQRGKPKSGQPKELKENKGWKNAK